MNVYEHKIVTLLKLSPLRMTESPLKDGGSVSVQLDGRGVTNRRNILLIYLSLFTGFLFLPLGISVHIWSVGQFSVRFKGWGLLNGPL